MTFRRRQLYAKSSICEFGRTELGFLGNCLRLSHAGVSVAQDPPKVQSIMEWATPTSCSEARRITGVANYYRRFVEAYAELAAQLTTLGSPKARFAYTQASFDAPNLKPAQLRRCITHFRPRARPPSGAHNGR